ncbi:hypothetical protein B0H67DRAFT_647405 [Lasiosphaeris hirsuta]|uniref:Major facilitator superfamily (MFS) profile domain-containing protein n=1 Tax=Lasiosphaeris hirsuta TaxID=260670 RepID=A0AA40AA63_9PEZI|nr:hypothetical protein B0H67DRAFT_647405 [Lasiosphaeris hirsuta]
MEHHEQSAPSKMLYAVSKWLDFWKGFRNGPHIDYEQDERRQLMDDFGFSKRVLFVGASGFTATAYTLFVLNVIKPALFYVYPPCGKFNSNAGMVLDELTLIGSALGMFVAGHLADLWGRKKLYGYELAALMIATLGMLQASEGFRSRGTDGGTSESSMDIYSWLAWRRFILGCAIGAEHPLVAIITAEWAATES